MNVRRIFCFLGFHSVRRLPRDRNSVEIEFVCTVSDCSERVTRTWSGQIKPSKTGRW